MALIAEFDATIDDFVDVTIRARSRSTIHGSCSRFIVTATVASALLALAMVNRPLAARLGAAFTTILIGLVLMALNRKSYRERWIRRLCREQIGPNESVRVRVELTGSGVALDQQQVHKVYDWSSIVEIEETEDAIYFYPMGADLFAVRKRAFESIDRQNQFLQMANHYLELNWEQYDRQETPAPS